MNWLEVSYHGNDENFELISQIFIDAGSKGVLLEDSNTPNEIPDDRFGEVYRLNAVDYPSSGVIVKGYLAVVPQVEVLLDTVKTKLFELAPESAASFTVITLAEEDWAENWKQHYQPIQISDKLVIKPSWLERSTGNVVEILLDPGMAFGSGTHETTRLCLQLLELYVKTNSRVVDVGTGSGILAIATAKLGAAVVYGVDLDEMAVLRAKENATLNGCDILIETNNLMDGVGSLAWQPNLIIANILAPVIIGMLADVSRVLVTGDFFICSGIISEEKDEVTNALTKNDFAIVEVSAENGWVAIVARKG
jgi:ribosomal protein L11 methyltransferase